MVSESGSIDKVSGTRIEPRSSNRKASTMGIGALAGCVSAYLSDLVYAASISCIGFGVDHSIITRTMRG